MSWRGSCWGFGLAALALVACAPGTDPFLPDPTIASTPEMDIIRIVDGDTVEVLLRETGDSTNVRLVGYDTPETFRPGCAAERALGEEAKLVLGRALEAAGEVDLDTQGTDKYRRLLGEITLDGAPLAQVMVQAGVAVPYDGGRRINWCERLATG